MDYSCRFGWLYQPAYTSPSSRMATIPAPLSWRRRIALAELCANRYQSAWAGTWRPRASSERKFAEESEGVSSTTEHDTVFDAVGSGQVTTSARRTSLPPLTRWIFSRPPLMLTH